MFITRICKNIRALYKIVRVPHAGAWMKIVEDIMKLATHVNEKKHPMLTQIRAINFGNNDILPKEVDIVSIWAGVGKMNPITRISHLRAQIEGLKDLIIEMKSQIPETEENKTLLLNVRVMLDSID